MYSGFLRNSEPGKEMKCYASVLLPETEIIKHLSVLLQFNNVKTEEG